MGLSQPRRASAVLRAPDPNEIVTEHTIDMRHSAGCFVGNEGHWPISLPGGVHSVTEPRGGSYLVRYQLWS